MTANQIAYQKNLIEQRKAKELERSNWAKETETNRSNLAKEAETMRSNKVNEGMKFFDTALRGIQSVTSLLDKTGKSASVLPLALGA